MTEQRFRGSSVVVTGAGQGIGAAIARRFLDEGARVHAVDIDAMRLESVRGDLAPEQAAEFLPRVVDIRDSAAVQSFFRDLDTLDVLVNNAGRASWGSVEEITEDEWNATVALDLTAVFLMIRSALPLLKMSRGNAVNVASISGLGADHRMAAYNAVKSAVINLTRSVAYDFGRDGIRVNVVAPGPVAAPHALALLTTVPEVRRGWLDSTPLGKIAEPSEIAAAVAFLASPEASHITGATLVVDGGLSLGTGQPDLTGIVRERDHL